MKKQDLERQVTIINNAMERIQPGVGLLCLTWEDKKVRVSWVSRGEVVTLSPGLSMGNMQWWLDGCEQGLGLGKMWRQR